MWPLLPAQQRPAGCYLPQRRGGSWRAPRTGRQRPGAGHPSMPDGRPCAEGAAVPRPLAGAGPDPVELSSAWQAAGSGRLSLPKAAAICTVINAPRMINRQVALLLDCSREQPLWVWHRVNDRFLLPLQGLASQGACQQRRPLPAGGSASPATPPPRPALCWPAPAPAPRLPPGASAEASLTALRSQVEVQSPVLTPSGCVSSNRPPSLSVPRHPLCEGTDSGVYLTGSGVLGMARHGGWNGAWCADVM